MTGKYNLTKRVQRMREKKEEVVSSHVCEVRDCKYNFCEIIASSIDLKNKKITRKIKRVNMRK